ncbi:TetR/AcrR family transcriptional regulator [Oceanobacillus sp. CAU 1775]
MTEVDPRQARSKKKLYEAYLNLLLAGHAQLNIRQLCQEANITRPTFYNNFSDILDLRKQLHDEILDDLNESLTIIDPKPIDAFKENELPENMVGLFKHIFENKKAYEVLLLHQPDSLFIRDVKKMLEHFIVEGMKYASSKEQVWETEIPFVVSFTTGAYYESIIWWIRNNYCYTPEQMAKLLLKISLHGPYDRG